MFSLWPGVESPDLQCEKLGVGVEVTRAIARENGIPAEIIFEYFGDWSQAKQENWHSIRLWKDYALLSPRETASMSLRFTWIPCKTPSAPKPKNLTASIGFLSRTTSISFTFNPMMDREELKVLWQSVRNAPGQEVGYDLFFLDCVDRLLVLHRKTGAVEEIALEAKRLRSLQQKRFEVIKKGSECFLFI